MCEIFPEVSKCCFGVSLRLGMLFIAVLGVMTGVTGLCIIEQISNASYDSLKNVSDIRRPDQVVSEISTIIPAVVTAMSVIFMFTGLVLLFATLADDEGIVQVFVWVTFLNVIIGFVLVVLVCLECVFKEVCMLGQTDWFSSSITFLLLVAYLFLWIYFISVANSYVLNVDT